MDELSRRALLLRATGLALASRFPTPNHAAAATAATQPPTPIRWLLTGAAYAAIAADPAASRVLNQTQPLVVRGTRSSVIPAGWDAIPVAWFASCAAIAEALQRRSLAPGVRGIIYDNENWKFTPLVEQQNPAQYEKLAADLVHAHGLSLTSAPAVDLVTVLAPGSPLTRYGTYLQLGIAASAARYADVINIQAQDSESAPSVYADFVLQAAVQARQANPDVLVFAGLSTSPPGQQVTAAQILSAIAATRDSVDGYWLNIPQPSERCPTCNNFRPDIAIEVMTSLAAT
jgi:hypothetical protein